MSGKKSDIQKAADAVRAKIAVLQQVLEELAQVEVKKLSKTKRKKAIGVFAAVDMLAGPRA